MYDPDVDVPEVKQYEDFTPRLSEQQKLYNALRFEMINFLMSINTKKIQGVIS